MTSMSSNDLDVSEDFESHGETIEEQNLSPTNEVVGDESVEWRSIFNEPENDNVETFETLLSRLESSDSDVRDSGAMLKLPRLGAQCMEHGLLHLSMDVDSVKGLFKFGNFMDAFNSTAEADLFPCFDVLTNLHGSKTIGQSGSRGATSGQVSRGRVSVPKIPEPVPICEPENAEGSELAWLQCLSPQQRWVSLAEIKHIQLATVKVGSIHGKVWWIFPNMKQAGNGQSNLRQARTPWLRKTYKKLVQQVWSKAKSMAVSKTQQILHVASGHGADDTEVLEQLEYENFMAYETCTAILKWRKPNESLKACMARVYKELTDAFIPPAPLSQHSTEHTARLSAAAFNAVLISVPIAIILVEPDARCAEFGYSLLYFDALGLKSQTSNFVESTSIPQLPIQLVNDALPNLKDATQGSCRVDMAMEWQGSTTPECALFWAAGCVPKVLSRLPQNLRSRARIYPQFGLLHAVNLQAHNLYWIPGTSAPGDFQVPRGTGVTFLGKYVPIAEWLDVEGNENSTLPLEVNLLNMYCPGPKRTSSTFNVWGMSFTSLAPYLSLHHVIPSTEASKYELHKLYLEVLQVKAQFLHHINSCVDPWSIRLELGALTPESAFEGLCLLREELGLQSMEAYSALPHHLKPIQFPLEQIKEYLVKHINLWWKEIDQAVTTHTLSDKLFLRACWAEQALQSCNFVLRGQPVWDYGTCIIFLQVASKEGYFHPSSVMERAERRRISAGRDISAFIQQILKVHCGSWERETILRLFTDYEYLSEKYNTLIQMPETARQAVRQMALRMVRSFYADIHAHLYRKGHWVFDTPPPFLSLLDVRQDPENPRNSCLDAVYGGEGSKVHPFRERGGMEVERFLRRWFPLHGEIIVKASPPMQYATPQLWGSLVHTLRRSTLVTLQKSIGIFFSDLRSWQLHERAVEVPLRTPIPLLVPDAFSGNRVFHQLNHWRIVVGSCAHVATAVQHDNREERNAPTAGAEPKVVLREERIKQEVQSVQHQLTRHRYTDHEVTVFVMFVYLEGGEDLILHNDFSSRLNVLGAYKDEDKQVLYCFRMRRTIRQIYDKVNSAKKKQKQRMTSGGFDLSTLRSLLQAALGSQPTPEKAWEWLRENQSKTLEDFRSAFHGGQGPQIDARNKIIWEHFNSCDLQAESPCSSLLRPRDNFTSGFQTRYSGRVREGSRHEQYFDEPSHMGNTSFLMDGSAIRTTARPSGTQPIQDDEHEGGNEVGSLEESRPDPQQSNSSGRTWRRYITSWFPM